MVAKDLDLSAVIGFKGKCFEPFKATPHK